MDTAAAHAGAEEKRAQVAHGQRFLVDIVADGEGVVRDILKQMMAPHVAQLILRKSSRKIRGRIAPGAALERGDTQARVAQLLPHDGSGPAETHQHSIYRFEGGRHFKSPTRG